MTGTTTMTTRQDAARRLVGEPRLDPWIAAIVTAGFGIWTWRSGHIPIVTADPSTQNVLLQTLAGAGAAVLGLGFTAVAILVAHTPGERLGRLLKDHRDYVTDTIRSAFIAFALLVVACLATLTANGSDAYTAFGWVTGYASTWSVIAVARLVSVFIGILNVDAGDKLG